MATLTPPVAFSNRSSTTSTSSSNASTSSDSSTASNTVYSSPSYRAEILRRHNIYVESAILEDETWSRCAFAMGMPYADSYCASPETRRFANKVQRAVKSKGRLSEKQATEGLNTLLEATMAKARSSLPGGRNGNDRKFVVKTGATFHREALSSPTSTSAPQLPTPKPSLTVGFTSATFNDHEHELQTGVIVSPSGSPCDLSKLSQPTADCFWPFFLVECHKESLYTAHNAAACSAVACNTALTILTSAVEDPSIRTRGRSITWTSQRTVESFSLSVSGTVASLNLHRLENGVHHSAMIRAYSLDDPRDVEAMFSRLTSIFVWAVNLRLPRVVDLLENLDCVVKLDQRDNVVHDDGGLLSVATGASAPRSGISQTSPPKSLSSGLRSIFHDLGPKWLRVHD
ncbi:hypothetical protein B0A52_04936 [Exophiala mesophila]|uniref:DUF7924 domain-containing protein n=1 Tax=Exophiala mesophila TaxID=212818 RepID=A0A438N6V1_EXOME|nr:hypothetical protein B0A52_04936 [Exophiala mesophila]